MPFYATPETEPAPEAPAQFVQVAANDIDAALDKNQKEQVKQAITGTKKLLETQWKEVEQSIADGMTSEEKEAAKEEYMREIERVNWQNIEQNLKADYEKIDWGVVNLNLANAQMQAKMDSVEQCYNKSLAEFNKLNKVLSTTCPSAPLPDLSIQQVEKAKADVMLRLEQVKKLKVKKVVSL